MSDPPPRPNLLSATPAAVTAAEERAPPVEALVASPAVPPAAVLDASATTTTAPAEQAEESMPVVSKSTSGSDLAAILAIQPERTPADKVSERDKQLAGESLEQQSPKEGGSQALDIEMPAPDEGERGVEPTAATGAASAGQAADAPSPSLAPEAPRTLASPTVDDAEMTAANQRASEIGAVGGEASGPPAVQQLPEETKEDGPTAEYSPKPHLRPAPTVRDVEMASAPSPETVVSPATAPRPALPASASRPPWPVAHHTVVVTNQPPSASGSARSEAHASVAVAPAPSPPTPLVATSAPARVLADVEATSAIAVAPSSSLAGPSFPVVAQSRPPVPSLPPHSAAAPPAANSTRPIAPTAAGPSLAAPVLNPASSVAAVPALTKAVPPNATAAPAHRVAPAAEPVHAPSISTLAGRKIRSFPPKKPKQPVPLEADGNSVAGSSPSSKVDTPGSTFVSPPVASMTMFPPPVTSPSSSSFPAAPTPPAAPSRLSLAATPPPPVFARPFPPPAGPPAPIAAMASAAPVASGPVLPSTLDSPAVAGPSTQAGPSTPLAQAGLPTGAPARPPASEAGAGSEPPAGPAPTPSRTSEEIAQLADEIFRRNLRRLELIRAEEAAKDAARSERQEISTKRKAEEETKRAAKAQKREEKEAQLAAKQQRREERLAARAPRFDADGNEIPPPKLGRPSKARPSDTGSESTAAPKPERPPRRDADGNEIPRRKPGRPPKARPSVGETAPVERKPKAKRPPKNALMDAEAMPSADLFPSDEEPLEEELIMEDWPKAPPPPPPRKATPPPPKPRSHHKNVEPPASPKKPSIPQVSPNKPVVAKAPAAQEPRKILPKPTSVEAVPSAGSVGASSANTLVAALLAPDAVPPPSPASASTPDAKPGRVRRGLPGIYVPPPPKPRKSKVPTEEPPAAMPPSHSAGVSSGEVVHAPAPDLASAEPTGSVEALLPELSPQPAGVSDGAAPSAPSSRAVVPTLPSVDVSARSPSPAPASDFQEGIEERPRPPKGPDLQVFNVLETSTSAAAPDSLSRIDSTSPDKRAAVATADLSSEAEAPALVAIHALSKGSIRAPEAASQQAVPAPVAAALSAASPAVPSASAPPTPPHVELPAASVEPVANASLVDDDDLVEDTDMIGVRPSLEQPVEAPSSEGEEEQEPIHGSPVKAPEPKSPSLVDVEDEMLWEEDLLTIEDADGPPVEDEDLIMEEAAPAEVKPPAPIVPARAPTASPAKLVARNGSPAEKPREEMPADEDEDDLVMVVDTPSPSPQPPSPPPLVHATFKRVSDPRPRSSFSSASVFVPTASTRRTNRQSEPIKPMSSSKSKPPPLPTASTRATRRESAQPVSIPAAMPTPVKASGPQSARQSDKPKSGSLPLSTLSPPQPSAPKPAPVPTAVRDMSPVGSLAGVSDSEEILPELAPLGSVGSSSESLILKEPSPVPEVERASPPVASVATTTVASTAEHSAPAATIEVAAPSPPKVDGPESSEAILSSAPVAVAAPLPEPTVAAFSPEPVFTALSPEPSVAANPPQPIVVALSPEVTTALSPIATGALSPVSSIATVARSLSPRVEEDEVLDAPDDLMVQLSESPASAPALPLAASAVEVVSPSPSNESSVFNVLVEHPAEIDDAPMALPSTRSPSPSSQKLLSAIGDHIFEDAERIMHPVDGSLGLAVLPPASRPETPVSSEAGVNSDDEIEPELEPQNAVDSDDEMPPSEPSATPSRKRIKLTHMAWSELMEEEEDADEDEAGVARTGKLIDVAESISSRDYENMLEMESERSSDEEMTWQQWEDMNRPTIEEVEEMTAFVKEQGSHNFIQHYLRDREVRVIRLLLAFDVKVTKSYRDPDLEDYVLIPLLKMALSKVLSKRDRLPQYSTWDDAVELIQKSQRIVVLSGAGISVSCGIPDFRSSDGLYAKLQEEGRYDLEDPQQMFDIRYFKNHPDVFYSFAHQIYPTNFTPSPCHRWIKTLEDKGKLLRNYTQNIDTLEHKVGIKKVLQCHGSFATASCLRCRRQVPGSEIEYEIMHKVIPVCEPCQKEEREKMNNRVKRRKRSKKKKDPWADSSSDSENEADRAWAKKLVPAIIKPDITFFGEELDDRFDKRLQLDRESVDLLIVIGSSLSVAPVSDLLAVLPHSVPQIMINKTAIRNYNPDINLVGDADGIILLLAQKLGWTLPPPKGGKRAISLKSAKPAAEPRQLGDTNYWLFKGASRTDLLGTVMKTLPKDVDVSWVQSDDEAEGDSDEDLLMVESDDGEVANDADDESVNDRANRDRDLSDDDRMHPDVAKLSRSSRSEGQIEVDVMEAVPEPEDDEDDAESAASMDDRPEWDLEEFEEEAPITLDDSEDGSTPPPRALGKVARPSVAATPANPSPAEEVVDEDELVMSSDFASIRPPPYETTRALLRSASSSSSDDELALRPASSGRVASPPILTKRKRVSSSPLSPVAGPSPPVMSMSSQRKRVSAPALPVPQRRSSKKLTPELASSRPVSKSSSAATSSTSAGPSRPASAPRPPPPPVNFKKVQRSIPPPAPAHSPRAQPEVVVLDSDDDDVLVMD